MAWLIVLGAIAAGVCLLTFHVSLWRARVAIEERRHVAADRWLSVARYCWPLNGEWHFLSVIVSRRTNDFERTKTELKNAHELGWPGHELERQQSLAYAQTGQFDQVGQRWSRLFQNAGSDGPDLCRAYINFLMTRFQLHEVADIVDGWRKDFPEDPGPWVVEGMISANQLLWSDAENQFQKALELDPTHDDARFRLAEAQIRQLKFSEAESNLSALTSRTPEVIASLAHCMAQQGRLGEALASLQSANESFRGNVGVLAELGRLQLMQGDYASALAALEDALKIQPENTEFRYAYAQALRNSGRETEAIEHFDRVNQATTALRDLARITRQVVSDPENIEARFKVAEITWRWKSRRDGLAWLLSVLDYEPNHRATHALLAEHYSEVGDSQKAETHAQMSRGE
jgi:tetratricopeptide (TPR) repeat protein